MAPAMATIPVPPDVAQTYAASNSQMQQGIQHMISHMVLEFVSPSVAGASNRALYEQDFYAWTQATAALIRAGQWYDFDREALAEEVESLGISQQHALESHLRNLVMHLLKWHYQPSMRQTGHSWEVSIINARDEIAILTENSTLLRNTVPELLPRRYPAARRLAAVETGIPLRDFPETCPWTAQQVLDADFWPDAPPESQTSDTR
jgi:uncharacterized protein DUF29